MHFAFLEISLKCPHCDHPTPMNGLLTRILCPECQRDMEAGTGFWKDVFNEAVRGLRFLPDGKEDYSPLTRFGGIQANLRYGWKRPFCEVCKTAYPRPGSLSEAGELVCPKCGQRTRYEPAPGWIRGINSRVRAVVGGVIQEKQVAGEGVVAGPVVFLCPRCNGSLAIDGKDRLVTCSFCKSQIYLPDDLWLRLHPAKVKERWYVGFEEPDASNASGKAHQP